MTRRTPSPRRLTGDTASTAVEAALCAPVLFAVFMAMFDFGLLELKQSQLSSAARDGARAGIVNWVDADRGSVTGGASCPAAPASFAAICNGVVGRLAGTPIRTITVGCYSQDTELGEPCTTDSITEGVDSLKVTVTYTVPFATFVGQTVLGSSRTYTSTARMVIQ